MADDSHSMTYYVPAGGVDLVATTVAQGDYTIRCQANHPLCVAAPWLPWRKAPGDTSVALLSTAAAASVMWSAMKADGDDDFEADLMCNILDVTAMDKACRQLTADEFKWDEERTHDVLIIALSTFVASRSHSAYTLTQESLQSIDPGPISKHPKHASAWITAIQVTHFATGPSESLWPLTHFEVVASPRTQLKDRYEKDMPMMRVAATVACTLQQHDTTMAAMQHSMATQAEMNAKKAEGFPQLFAAWTIPLCLLTISYNRMNTKDVRRLRMLDHMIAWQFNIAARSDMIKAAFIQCVKAADDRLVQVLLPCDSNDECLTLEAMLRHKLLPSVETPDMQTLASLGARLKDLVTVVSHDDRKHKPGREKVEWVLQAAAAQQDATNPLHALQAISTSTISGTSNASSGSKSQAFKALSPEAILWVNSEPVQVFEREVVKLAEADNFQDAAFMLSRSGWALFVQLLHGRTTLGASLLVQYAPQLKRRKSAMLAFAIAADTGKCLLTGKDNALLMPEKLKLFPSKFPDTKFAKQIWANWRDLDPYEVKHLIDTMQRGSGATLLVKKGDPRFWSDVGNNRTISELMDRAFHTLGYTNGVFTDFICKANDTLENAAGLSNAQLKHVEIRVTQAVQEGLGEAFEAYNDFISSPSHKATLPQNGDSLLKYGATNYEHLIGTIKAKIGKAHPHPSRP